MPKWLDLAKEEINTRERAGKAINPKIKAYYEDAGHPYIKDDAVPWCAAFVGAMLKRAGLKGTGALTARSYLTWGKPLKKPVPGAIMIFRRGNSEWQGHVAFYVDEDETHYHVLGGNQRDAVNIAKYPKSGLLGIRWPSTFATSRRVTASIAGGVSTLVGAGAEVAQEFQPVAEQASQFWSWASYAALACAFIAAVSVVWFSWQAKLDGKYSQ